MLATVKVLAVSKTSFLPVKEVDWSYIEPKAN
jgi:hypothetical protein